MKNIMTLYRTNTLSEQDQSENKTEYSEPIRESLAIFILKISLILIVTDILYAVMSYVLLEAFFLNHQLPLNLHAYAPALLTITHIIKTIFQVSGISSIVFSWIGNSYQITHNHLIHKTGIMNCVEKIYDLDIIRSVSIQQSWLGRVFHFGTVSIEVSASGGYTDQIILHGVANPRKYEQMLSHNF